MALSLWFVGAALCTLAAVPVPVARGTCAWAAVPVPVLLAFTVAGLGTDLAVPVTSGAVAVGFATFKRLSRRSTGGSPI